MNRRQRFLLHVLLGSGLSRAGSLAIVRKLSAFAPAVLPRGFSRVFGLRTECSEAGRLTTAAFSSDPTSDVCEELNYVDPRLVASAVRPSVALVVPVGVRNSTARGSGFVVDFPPKDSREASERRGEKRGKRLLHLLTAAHVAAPGHRINVTFPSDSSFAFEATVLGRDVRADLALLRVELPGLSPSMTTDPQPLQLGPGGTEVGTPAFAIGYPSGGVVGAAMTSGIVCATALGLSTADVMGNMGNANSLEGKIDGEARTDAKVELAKTVYVVTDAAMAGGMSGGPLISAEGTVLGVNALVNMELRALGNYAVDATECRAFLSELAERFASVDPAADDDKLPASMAGFDAYRLMIYNDRFNKRERVANILNKVAMLERDEAERIMMEAHTKGKSIIREFPRRDQDEARNLCDALRREDILVELEQVLGGQ